ncbi:sugar O-acetyltransferase [Chitinibacter fontanus]|uniref:Nodulation protein L n=1 Tax=Chitinibacter fontanus TaxID=1737446 RepID=A0A7D5V9G6_9NEIS|nr:sugar O-acetyltransferase [Chitinibacter fontanus]QLI81358.1 sugar O-acetyltransferase [Chitinibacter fontanus]
MSSHIRKFAFEDIGKHDRSTEHELINRYNSLDNEQKDERTALLKEIFAQADEVIINGKLNIVGGKLISLGRKVFINVNVEIAAAAPISIGHHTLISPNVQIQTGTHPVDPTERQQWAFWAKPITIGANVWIGANAIICPGVTIGDHSVIGAGSVVSRDIPACSLAVGNPAQVVRQLTPPDESTLYAKNP